MKAFTGGTFLFFQSLAFVHFLTFPGMRRIHLNAFRLLTGLEPKKHGADFKGRPLSLSRFGERPICEGDRSHTRSWVSRMVPGQEFDVGLLLLLLPPVESCASGWRDSHACNGFA